MIRQLLYASEPAADLPPTAIEKLLSQARANNQKNGITGFLMFDGENFVQLIEGREAAIDRLFARIRLDRRHKHVQALIKQNASGPVFSNWAMAYLNADQQKRNFAGTMTLQLARRLVTTLDFGDVPLRKLVADFLRELTDKAE